MSELRTRQETKPRVVPALIALWAAILLFIFILGPAFRETGRTRFSGIFFFFLFAGGIWAGVGTARLRPPAVRTILVILIGYPLFVMAKALVTGYFSLWLLGLLSVIVIINAVCVLYLFRSGTRAFWSPGLKKSRAA